jgi:hypothetical protein
MKLAEKLARLLMSRDDFSIVIRTLLGSTINSIMMMEHADTDLNRLFTMLLPKIEKESIWLIEGEYENYINILAEVFDRVYTPEQQTTLMAFYEANPWALMKGKEVAQAMAEGGVKIGQRVSEACNRNLKDEIEEAIKVIDGENYEPEDDPWKE